MTPRPYSLPLAVVRTTLALLVLTSASIAQARYTVVDLGLGGGRPEAINELGEIVGRRTVGGQSRIFVHDPRTGGVTDPGLPSGTINAFPRDLNEAGHVVGNAWSQPIEQPGRSFLFTPGAGMRDLGQLTTGGRSTAFAVDNFGNVGGAADGSSILMEAFYWPAGGPMQSLQPGFAGSVAALADNGWQVGSLGPSNRRPFVTDPAGTRSFVPLPAGSPIGGAAAVSENGWVAGEMSDLSGSVTEIFRYHAPSARFDNLGLIGRYGAVHGVDSEGTVVGFRQISTRIEPDALISIGGNPWVAIDTLLAPGSNWTVLRAKGINESGQICASARLGSGPPVPVRLDPVRSTGAAGSSRAVAEGCSGIALRAGVPHIGRPWSLALRGARPAQGLTLLVSPGHPFALRLPGLACPIHVTPTAIVDTVRGTSNVLGSWAQVVPVPNYPTLIGGTLTIQAAVMDGNAPLGIRLSSARRLAIGS